MANWRAQTTARALRHTRKPHSFLDCTTENDFHFNLWNSLFLCSLVGNGHIFIFGRFCCLPTAVFKLRNLKIHSWKAFVFFCTHLIIKYINPFFSVSLYPRVSDIVRTAAAAAVAADNNRIEPNMSLHPYFDFDVPRNITARVGQTAFLRCHVEQLGDKSVSHCKLCREKKEEKFIESELKSCVASHLLTNKMIYLKWRRNTCKICLQRKF